MYDSPVTFRHRVALFQTHHHPILEKAMIIRIDSLLCRCLLRLPFLRIEHARVGRDTQTFARVSYGPV